ncbi:hypothetical protein MYCTH_2127753 [Thermothelomyces thermophilus ATCC 42464]|uniref:F-box domain-containing protein n=1 Tax=Thermothelomyces thermophilus (strain ATCC 42464 / BCRC 31852 / DSM 1799) TaxID=573729 RepID=G2QH45_THET4|nr:uncharacterized protein MYCTH_2127753 [Thermothelomyces thermophilus ATCC 42464]AEO58705.1 hypothetical protein MYCTH_2127753 [Thermothelomyces thermophilus ATCC 42464]
MELDHQAGPIGLASLPDELISLILRNFCLHCRQGTRETPHAYFPATGQKREERSWYAVDVSALHAMCLVSRRFLPFAQEILYHEFAWAYGDSSASLMDDWSHRLTAFLRTVARKKDLAALVKRVYICLTHFFIIPETEADSVLEDAAHARGIRLADFLDTEFLSSDIIACLVRNKNTLHTLHLKYDVDSQTQDGSARSLAELESSLNTFPALRNLFLTTTLLYQMIDGSAEDDSILTRLLPPSLVSLQLAVVDDNPWLNLRLEISVMADLARAVSQGHFPHLRRVSCIPTTKGRLDMHRLEAMFSCAGVKFGYDGWQFHDGVAGERVYSLGPSPAYSTALTVGSDDESLQSW